MSSARMAPYALSLCLAMLPALTAHAEKIRWGEGGNTVDRSETFDERSDTKRVRLGFHLRELELGREGLLTKLDVPGIQLTSELGQPRLPFQAVTVPAGAEDIVVHASLGSPVAISAGRLFPAQEEPCRCPAQDSRPKEFLDQVLSYKSPEGYYRMDSLGDFRGTPLSRVTLLPHRYDPGTGMLYLYPEAKFEVSYRFRATADAPRLYDYLVIVPRDWASALEPWLAHKRSQGLSFHVQDFEGMQASNAEAIRKWIHAEYDRAHFRYSLIVGGDNRVPQMRVETTTDRNTPSDLPYYTMGGANDVVPEVLSGRVVAEDSATLSRVLQKWMAYEQGSGEPAGWGRVLGVASDEGSSPSDAEYVQSIQERLTQTFHASSVYFYQANSDSNPAAFNAAMNDGASWMTYLGHGSGTDWPSFGQSYSVSHIAQMRNAGAVKPIWVDVACLNGILRPANAGAHLVGDAAPDGAPIGVTGYIGGTVLISWHPPAIFARGMAFALAATPSPVLGEMVQAGQKYLSENRSNAQDVASNQRWYHLQGDPSLRLRMVSGYFW